MSGVPPPEEEEPYLGEAVALPVALGIVVAVVVAVVTGQLTLGMLVGAGLAVFLLGVIVAVRWWRRRR